MSQPRGAHLPENGHPLYQPFALGSLTLRNRLLLAPMETNACEPDGAVSERIIDYHRRRAAGGVGMSIVEFTCVRAPDGIGGAPQLRLDEDRFIDGQARLAAAIRAEGAAACLQIHHAGRQTTRQYTGGAQPVSPSAVPCPMYREVPRALEVAEIEELVERFASAAQRAVIAGYDAVELHGAHGYLLGSFLSPAANHRTDAWGGSLENRLRFPLAVVRAAKAAMGDRPLIYRLSATEFVENGLEIDEAVAACEALADAGVDALHVSTGAAAALDYNVDPVDAKEGWRLPLARRVRAAVQVPVIGVGVIRWPETAEAAIDRGDCDLVAMGRALLADPDWPMKAASGLRDAIRPCTSCNWCIDRLGAHREVGCAENPETMREGAEPAPRMDGLSALVVGGGPGGVEAALRLDALGAAVTLLERRSWLFEGVALSGAPPGKDKFLWYRDHLARRLDGSGVTVETGVEADAALIAARRPDLVVLAVGGAPRARGAAPDAGDWIAAESVLLGEAALAETTAETGPVLVWGGGETGAETAEFAAEHGRDVVLVTTQPAKRIARRAQYTYRRRLIPRLLANPHVRIAAERRLQGVEGDRATLVDPEGGLETVTVSQKVVAQGREPRVDLSRDPMLADLPVMVIGDARDVRRIGDAVEDAYLAVRAAAFDRASGRLTPGWRWPGGDAEADAPDPAGTQAHKNEPAGTSPAGHDPQPRWRE